MVNKKIMATLFLCSLCLTSAFAASKNVIFVIADGTGPAVMGMMLQYARQANDAAYPGKKSNMELLFKDSQMGVLLNTPIDTIATDSAASATQLATGATTFPGAIGVDASNNEVESMLETAKKHNKATGIITDVYVLDATPAAFFAHQKNRTMYKNIAQDLLKTQPDVVLGGGLNYFVGPDFKSKYDNIAKKIPYIKQVSPRLEDNALFEDILKQGYAFVFDKKSLESVKSQKIMGLFAPVQIPFNINKDKYAPSLKDMAKKAVETLSQNPNGFFLMLEAGAIDWVVHDQDQGAALQELLQLDKALAYLHAWAKENGDTMLILTADHDTAGFAINYRKLKGEELQTKTDAGYKLYEKVDYSSQNNWSIIASQTKMMRDLKDDYEGIPEKAKTPKNMQKFIQENMGYTLPIEYLEDEDDIEKVLKEVSKRLGVAWATGSHTASPLLISVYGSPKKLDIAMMHSSELKAIVDSYLYE